MQQRFADIGFDGSWTFRDNNGCLMAKLSMTMYGCNDGFVYNAMNLETGVPCRIRDEVLVTPVSIVTARPGDILILAD